MNKQIVLKMIVERQSSPFTPYFEQCSEGELFCKCATFSPFTTLFLCGFRPFVCGFYNAAKLIHQANVLCTFESAKLRKQPFQHGSPDWFTETYHSRTLPKLFPRRGIWLLKWKFQLRISKTRGADVQYSKLLRVLIRPLDA